MTSKVKNNIKKFADQALLAGAVSNYEENTQDNPKGKIDWVKLVGQLTPLVTALTALLKLIL